MSKADINCHCGSGRIGKELEVRHTNSGTAVVDVSICMNIGFGKRQKPVWTRLTVWGKSAEFLGQYAHVGDKLTWSNAQYNVDEFEGREGAKKVHYFEVGQGGQVNLESKDKNSGDREPAAASSDDSDDDSY